ncbi:MAG TPA: chromate efflux transporter [Gemmatimonadales bacterium]|nr:chromate efflux transporter [Gemmatimonadales bacterium]
MARGLSGELRGLAGLFLGLGVLGFGGPAAHIAMMEERVVRRRGWMTREEFLEMVGVVNLLPGPNSTELAIHIGYRRAGVPGLLVAGLAFILPATLIVLLCAWAYVRSGTVPAVQGIWRGVQPVVVAVVVTALAGFARTGLRSPRNALVAAAALLLGVAGVNEFVVLLAAGALSLGAGAAGLAAVGVPLALPLLLAPGGGPSAGRLFLFFLQVGSVLYGSGYVLLAFLRGGLVERAGWLTETQLLDAVAVGQATPGPVFTTATFVGYLLAGPGGALAATAGIFLPAFVLVGASGPLIAWVRRSRQARLVLDGVTAGSLALMAVVAWQLGRAALDGPAAVVIAGTSVLLLRAGVNSAVLMLAAAAAGLLLA